MGMAASRTIAVQADAQDGGDILDVNHIDNANFGTPPDGQTPRMQMYLFDLTNPMRDGDFDNSVIIHEYGHGVSNRLTGGPANASALDALQSGGMGEGWSDFYALMFLQRPTDTPNSAIPVGTYVLGEPPNGAGIRQFPYSFNMAIDPHNYANFNGGNNEVHDTGEIWASTLWDMNWLLINKYGYDSNLYTGWSASPGPAHAGNKLALRLVMDAMKLQPANPSFTQARDAILAADVALNGGADLLQIWTAFARRGLGANAFTASSASTSVTTDSTIPSGLGGISVVSTTPGASSVVGASPTQYVVNLSNPVDPANLDASDFQVNGSPANAYVLSNANQTITFTFDSDPVVAQGVQTMHISAGAFTGSLDASPVKDLSTFFRYDVSPLQVVSTAPANGVFSVPGSVTYDVTFSEAIDPASVQASDLGQLGANGAVVTAATVLPGNLTARFTISGMSSEGAISTNIAAEAITDQFGNIGTSFSANFTVDIISTPYPVPLARKSPIGSLIYDPIARRL